MGQGQHGEVGKDLPNSTVEGMMKGSQHPEYFIMWRMVGKLIVSAWQIENKSFTSWTTATEERQKMADEWPNLEVIITGKFEA
jgi:hypothetical protein